MLQLGIKNTGKVSLLKGQS